MISNKNELVFVAGKINNKEKINETLASISHYKVMSDINLENEEWEPIGTSTNPFRGRLDGNGFKIKNLKISKPDLDYVGLFSHIKDSEIKNISIENAIVVGKRYTAALVGNATNSKLNRVSVTGTGQVKGNTSYTAGLVGQSSSTIMEESFSTINIEGKDYTGGLIGNSF